MRKKNWRPVPLVLAVLIVACMPLRPKTAAPADTPTGAPATAAAATAKPLTTAEVIETSKATDWKALDPENTLYVDLRAGRVILELAPDFAPTHVANIKALVREKYFDGLAIVRAQDNYVVQWADPDEDDDKKRRPIQTAKASLTQEFSRPMALGLPFAKLPDPDTYAPETGYSGDFPAARDPQSGRTWLAHCYGAVGAARGASPDSGSGSSLYVVIGHAPRHLDRNVTLVGRVLRGMELLSALPRGKGPLGFYVDPKSRTPIKSIRVAADVPAAERVNLEVLRTDTPTFAAYVESRRSRHEEWFVEPTGHIELCNVALPVREVTAP